jgi:PAS domain S-box-containing protein
VDGETNGASDRDAGSSSPGGHVSQPRPGLPDDVADLQARVAKLEWRLAEARRRRRDAEATCNTLTRVLEATSDAFVALDADWRYTYVNERAGRMFGREPASLLGKHIWTEFPEGVGQPFHEAYERAVIAREPQQLEAYYAPYDRWFENRIFPYAGGLAIFFQDVTERRRAADRLRESEQRYRSLFDHHPDAIYSFDAQGRFVSANAACEALTGYRLDELVGKSYLPLVVPEDRARATEHFHAALAGSADSYEESIIHNSGRRVDIAITKLPIVVDGDIVGIYGIAKDLTAQRALENRLKQAERMEAVGRLATGIAHDFNNLLTIIQSCADLLTVEMPRQGNLHADVEEIQNTARRASELTQQLLAFGRKQHLLPQVLDINHLVGTFVATLRRVTGERIAIETQLSADAWPIFADPIQLERVLMNLGVNARDAMPNGGTLRVRTENVMFETSVLDEPRLAPGPYVALVVEDTGSGIDPAILPHIFEPFVTTKPHGLGTGLGLATVYGIIEQTGGTIQVDSTPGRGTRFVVYLPRATDSNATDANAAAA